ncbi:hypothetical protein BgiMline_003837 [Biomphalaria glabrata]|nr:hypothetical protein; partial [Biomphalaria glabrata]
MRYFESTYIRGPAGRDPLFSMRIRNHYEAARTGLPRTTGCSKGFHNALKAFFNCSHPGVWDLLEGLKKDIAIYCSHPGVWDLLEGLKKGIAINRSHPGV